MNDKPNTSAPFVVAATGGLDRPIICGIRADETGGYVVSPPDQIDPLKHIPVRAGDKMHWKEPEALPVPQILDDLDLLGRQIECVNALCDNFTGVFNDIAKILPRYAKKHPDILFRIRKTCFLL